MPTIMPNVQNTVERLWTKQTLIFHFDDSHNSQSNGGGYGGGYNELEEVPDDLLMELMTRFGRTIIRARNDLEK